MRDAQTPPDAVETLLRLVAEGHLTAEEAEPMLSALSAPGGPGREPPTPPTPPSAPSPPSPSAGRGRPGQQSLHLVVTDGGRASVDLRIPLALAGMAGSVFPGISATYADQIREAVRSGQTGTILEVTDEDGDGVRIALD